MENVKKEIKGNEIKGNETKGIETNAVDTTNNEAINSQVQQQVEQKQLFVERSKNLASDGKEYWNYFVKGRALGRDIRVDFIPKDKGGYEVLEILFSLQDKARLVIGEESTTDSVTGKVSRYKTYTLQFIDENDEDKTMYDCSVKPARDSDKALLGMLLKQKV